jgi:hypothetical protein
MYGFTRIAVTLVCMGAVCTALAVGQEVQMTSEMKQAAASGLDQARSVIAQSDNPGLLGLTSTREIDSARLGAAIMVHTLSYDALLDYRADTPLDSYFSGPTRSVVPVEVDGEVRSWVTLERTDNDWRMTGFGESANAMAVDKVVRAAGERDASLIHAPAFNLYMVRIAGDRGTEVVPVGPNTVAELAAGKPIEIKEAMSRLADHARKVEAEYGEEIRARRVVD